MDHLNLLQISSPADGLIYLNGTLAGELLGGELSLCIPRGRFCLSFSPLGQEEGKVFLIRPSEPLSISRTSKDPAEIEAVYQIGMEDGKRQLPALLEWLRG